MKAIEEQGWAVKAAVDALIQMAWMAVAVLAVGVCVAQTSAAPKFPTKTGVPGVERPIDALVPTTEFPVEGHPDWMAVTLDGVWVTSSSANHVVRLNARTNTVDRVVTVNRPCSGLATGFGGLWIPVCGDHKLVEVGETSGKPWREVAAGPADSEGGVTTGAGSVWMVSAAEPEMPTPPGKRQTVPVKVVLNRIDPLKGVVVARIALPDGSYNPLFAAGMVWVTSNRGNELVRVDPRTNQVAGTTPTGKMPRFLTYGAGSVWTLNQGDGTVTRVDARTGKALATIQAGIPGLGGEITFGAGKVWATVFGFPITRIDPRTNRVTAQWTGKGGDSIRVAHHSVWLTYLMGAKVARIPVPEP
jgi:streptogramin lyase